MNPADLPALAWLAILCAPPLLIALLLGFTPRRPDNGGPVRIGNPMLKKQAVPVLHDAELRPLLYLTRTQSDADLRALILGLRHMPLKDTAFILQRYRHSADPELQLHSQGILQEKQEQLQATFTRLLARATPDSPANLASFIEAGLNLIASPLTPESEHAAILRKIFPKAEALRNSKITHPRAVFAAARFCLRTRQVAHAGELLARLPQGSPLHGSLSALVTHHAAILHPPPPLTSGYQMQ